MKLKERIYLICYENDYFRKGKIANIVGLKRITSFKNNTIANIIESSSIFYHIKFEDGEEDYVDLHTIKEKNWHFVTLDDLLRVGMPQ